MQKHGVGQDRVVRPAEIAVAHVQQPRVMAVRAEPFDEGRRRVRPVHVQPALLQVRGLAAWAGANLQHVAARVEPCDDGVQQACHLSADRRCRSIEVAVCPLFVSP